MAPQQRQAGRPTQSTPAKQRKNYAGGDFGAGVIFKLYVSIASSHLSYFAIRPQTQLEIQSHGQETR
jgi:hypothetical protein